VIVHTVTAAQAAAGLGRFSAVIDARSEGEFALDHLPGAHNWPSLNDAERKLIGTIYKQVSPFEAQKRGAALVAANIARHIERHLLDTPKNWQPLIYCWRGGKRSGSLALVLAQIGFRVTVIEGGYKAFRVAVIEATPPLVAGLRWRVICGPTGSGKTRLLAALQAAGGQVLDLEALASHRSSVLGAVPGCPQPSQKRFETLLWDRLRSFDPARPVYVESESRKVGNLAVPQALINAMRASPCIDLQLPEDERVGLLMEDYADFARDAELFCERLALLTELRGKAVVKAWQEAARAGRTAEVVRDLLATHYDPGYAASMARNFNGYADALPLPAADRHALTWQTLARRLLDDGH
jgi:tRNA 2-selenouridine synthase